MIWHIDRRYGSYHNIVDLEEADGCDDLDNGWGYRPDPHYYHHELGDSGDPFPGDSNSVVFDSVSYPSSNDNWGNPTQITVRNIELIADTVVCDIIIDPMGVSESTEEHTAVVFTAAPNPFRKSIHIAYSVKCNTHDADIFIYNASGRLVTSHRITPDAPRTTFVWDGTDGNGRPVSEGVYFIRLETADLSASDKVIKLE
jgi:hypothetical protein